MDMVRGGPQQEQSAGWGGASPGRVMPPLGPRRSRVSAGAALPDLGLRLVRPVKGWHGQPAGGCAADGAVTWCGGAGRLPVLEGIATKLVIVVMNALVLMCLMTWAPSASPAS